MVNQTFFKTWYYKVCSNRIGFTFFHYCQTPVVGLGLGVDFTFAEDNDNDKNDNPHLNFMKGTVLGEKEQGVGIRDKG